jgi:ketopantoate reductase
MELSTYELTAITKKLLNECRRHDEELIALRSRCVDQARRIAALEGARLANAATDYCVNIKLDKPSNT